ncbi:MAG: OmpA family protein [Sphingomonas sp.]|nr:OmpA family protein [Sphingomonas sp.]
MRKIGLTLLVSAMAALPHAALAQDAATADDYVCAFTGECADEQADETPQPTATTPEGGRVSASRGFSLSTSSPSAGNTARRPAPRARPSAQQAARNTARAPRVISRQPGRVDLSLSFGLGSAVLSPAAQAQIRAFAEALQRPQLATMRVAIEGHTDSSGSRATNVSLSQRRAQAVADYLVAQGVARSRLDVRGYGYDRPLQGTRASDPDNRRVEAVRVS